MNKKVFKDKEGKKIIIMAEDDFIRAYTKSGEKIGEFHYHSSQGFEDIFDTYKLHGMNIDSNYQRRGIGTEMLKFGEKIFKYVNYPNSNETNKEGNHLSSEELTFLKYCNSKGIIKRFYNEEDEYDEYYGGYRDYEAYEEWIKKI